MEFISCIYTIGQFKINLHLSGWRLKIVGNTNKYLFTIIININILFLKWNTNLFSKMTILIKQENKNKWGIYPDNSFMAYFILLVLLLLKYFNGFSLAIIIAQTCKCCFQNCSNLFTSINSDIFISVIYLAFEFLFVP